MCACECVCVRTRAFAIVGGSHLRCIRRSTHRSLNTLCVCRRSHWWLRVYVCVCVCVCVDGHIGGSIVRVCAILLPPQSPLKFAPHPPRPKTVTSVVARMCVCMCVCPPLMCVYVCVENHEIWSGGGFRGVGKGSDWVRMVG